MGNNKEQNMMRKVLCALAGVAMIIAMSSCREQQYYSMYNHADSRYINGTVGKMATKNVEADLKIENSRVVYQERFDNDLEDRDVNNPKNSKLINYMKEYTVYKAISRYEADLLVGATFSISTSVDGKYVTVEVRGYPASYTNFRQVTCPNCQKHAEAGCGHEHHTADVKVAEPQVQVPAAVDNLASKAVKSKKTTRKLAH